MNNLLDDELDNEFEKTTITSIQHLIKDSEQILWTGKPKYKFSLTPLELGGYDVALGPTNLYFLALGFLWFHSYRAYQDVNYVFAVFLFIAGLLIFLLPDIVKEIRRRNTFYAITTKQVFFKLWGLRKNSLHSFDIMKIGDIKYEEYKDKSGILYFMLKEPPAFKTYDFSAGGSRHYPTFENINNVMSLYKKILKIKNASK